jgi:hypothetical protein
MRAILMFLPFIRLLVVVHGSMGSFFPECSSMIYDPWNRVDVEKMIYNCSGNIQGALFPPSYFDATPGDPFLPTIVNVSVAINSIIKIDDIEGELSLDYWFRMFWTDARWQFPEEMWNHINPKLGAEGIELTQYVRTDGNPLNLWLPDTYAVEAISSEKQSELIHLFPNGSLWWSRHLVAVLKQGQMSLKNYPMDNQEFIIAFESFGYDTRFVELKPFTAMETVTFNVDPHSHRPFVAINPLWTFKSSQYDVKDHNSPIFFDQKRTYSAFTIFLEFKRDSFGIVFRLALPVLMFLFLVGFAFWAELDKRVDVTITMLLAVSALYLIIGSIIPFVGYFSILDKFVTTAFCILSLTAGVHYMVCYLDAEKAMFPLNELWMILIVYFCRICWAPFIFLFGVIYYFPELIYGVIVPVVIILLMTTGATLRQLKDIEVIFRKCICHLKVKHFYEEVNIPYIHMEGNENEEPTDKLVISPLTFLEKCFFYFVITRNVSCACELFTQEEISDSSSGAKGGFSFMNLWKNKIFRERPYHHHQERRTVIPIAESNISLEALANNYNNNNDNNGDVDIENPNGMKLPKKFKHSVSALLDGGETSCRLQNFAVRVATNYLGGTPAMTNKCQNTWCPKCCGSGVAK